MLFYDHHSQASFLFLEKRLLYKVPQLEILKTQTMEMLKRESPSEQQLDNVAGDIQKSPEEKNVMQSIEASLPNLLEKERAIATKNYERLKEKIRLRSESKDAQRTLAEKVQDLHPKNWSEETTENVKNVGKIALVGGAVGVGLWLLSKLRSGAEVAADAGKKAVSTSWSFMKWLLVGAAFTGIGFGIWKLAEKYKEITSVQNRMMDLQTKIREETNAIKKKAYEKELEMLKKLEDLYAKKNAPPPAPLQTATKTTPPPVPEKAPEALPASLLLFPPVIVTAEGAIMDRHQNLSSTEKRTKVTDVLLKFANAGVTVEKIHACVQGESINAYLLAKLYSPPTNVTDAKERLFFMDAAEAVVLFFHHRKNQMKKFYEKNPGATKAIEKLTMEEYLKEAGGVYALMGGLYHQAETQGEQFLEDQNWRNIEKQFISQSNTEIKKILQKAGQGGKAIENLTFADILNFTATGSIEGYLHAKKDMVTQGKAGPAEEALYRLCEDIQKNPPNLLPFFHQLFPDAHFTEDELKNRKQVNTYLLSRMPLRQAISIVLYTKMLDDGNPIGLVMTQLEILRFVSSVEGRKIFPVTKYRIGERLLFKGGRKLMEEYGKNAQQIEEVIDDAETTAVTLGSILKEKAWDATTAGVRNAGGLIAATGAEAAEKAIDHPEYAIPIGIVTLLGSIGAGEIMYHRLTEPTKVVEALGKPGKRSLIKGLKHSQEFINNRVNAAKVLSELYTKLQNVGTSAKGVTEGQEALHNFLKTKRTVEDLRNFGRQISAIAKAHGKAWPEGVTESMRSLLDNKEWLKQIQNFKWYRRLGRYAATPLIAAYNVGKMPFSGALHVASYVRASASSIASSKLWPAALKATKTEAAEIMKILKSINMPQWMVDAFSASRGAMEMLIKAAATKGGAGVEYLMKLATAGKFLGKATGVGALGLDAVMCIVEIQANKARIAGTDTEALKDLYADRNWMSGASAAAGTNLGISLYATGLASAYTLAFALPLALEVGVAAWYHGKLEEASEGWLREEKDWAKLSPEDLLAKLMEMKPGAHAIGQKSVYGTQAEWLWRKTTYSRAEFQKMEQENYGRVEDANAGARYKICRAYIVKTTEPAPLPSETPEQWQNRYDRLVMDQIQYIGWMTQNEYDTVNIDVFRSALNHAELMAKSRDLKIKDESLPVKLEQSGETFDLKTYADMPPKQEDTLLKRGAVLKAYEKQVNEEAKVLHVNAALQMSDAGEAADVLAKLLLSDLKFPLQRLEAKIRSTDYPGVADGYETDLARYAAFTELRDCFDQEVKAFLENDEITAEAYSRGLSKLSAILQRDPLELYQRGTAANLDISAYRDRQDLLSIQGFYQEITKS